ncbi:hypothetical protein QUA54_00175 [Microcoleus sp. MOSTC5]
MTEGFNAADNSLLVPVILLIALDNCQNSVVGRLRGENWRVARDFFA